MIYNWYQVKYGDEHHYGEEHHVYAHNSDQRVMHCWRQIKGYLSWNLSPSHTQLEDVIENIWTFKRNATGLTAKYD